jgi:HSP90 family molecular chaperone
MPARTSPPKFTMEFEPATIEHLGLKLYVSLPPVIGELVSNAWDADSTKVEITFPEATITPDSEVVVKDYGTGMDAKEVQDAYLRIGRNRRQETGKSTSPKDRPLMGRKGIGKLSAFGCSATSRSPL